MSHDGVDFVLGCLLLVGSGSDSNVALDPHDSLLMQGFVCLSNRGTHLVPRSLYG